MIINRLPSLLQEKQMSIRELARQTGVAYTTIRAIYHMERRSIQFSVLEAICLILDTQPGQIFVIHQGNTMPEAEPEIGRVEANSLAHSLQSSTGPQQRLPVKENWKNW